MQAPPPRPPNLSELAEMGARVDERMRDHRAAAQAAASVPSAGEEGLGVAARLRRLLGRMRTR